MFHYSNSYINFCPVNTIYGVDIIKKEIKKIQD